MTGDEFIVCIETMDNIFECKNILDEKRVQLTAIKLKGKALAWFKKIKNEGQARGKEKVCPWEKLKKLMYKTFLPTNYIAEYAKEFNLLLARNNLVESEEQSITRFIDGL